MEIYQRDGTRLSLTSIRRTVKNGDGTSRTAACRDGGWSYTGGSRCGWTRPAGTGTAAFPRTGYGEPLKMSIKESARHDG